MSVLGAAAAAAAAAPAAVAAAAAVTDSSMHTAPRCLLPLLPASQTPTAVKGYSRCVLTPNIAELGRIAEAVDVKLPGRMGTHWQEHAQAVTDGVCIERVFILWGANARWGGCTAACLLPRWPMALRRTYQQRASSAHTQAKSAGPFPSLCQSSRPAVLVVARSI